MRIAQEAQVMPPMTRSTVVVGVGAGAVWELIGTSVLGVGAVGGGIGGRGGVAEDEPGGADLAIDLEVEEQGIGPGRGHLDGEANRAGRLVVEWVHVQVGEIA